MACGARPGGLPRAASQKAGWSTARRPGPAAEAARDARKQGARSRCGHLVRAGAVMRLTVVRWGLAGGKVLPASTGGVPGWCRDGGVEVGLTLAVAAAQKWWPASGERGLR
jgi:hypothetical protein